LRQPDLSSASCTRSTGRAIFDANRTIGNPQDHGDLGRKSPQDIEESSDVIEDLDLPNPVIRSHYGHGFIKQYVRDHLLLAPSPPPQCCRLAVKKAIADLPQLRQKLPR